MENVPEYFPQWRQNAYYLAKNWNLFFYYMLFQIIWNAIIFEMQMLVMNVKYAFKYIYNKKSQWIKVKMS